MNDKSTVDNVSPEHYHYHYSYDYNDCCYCYYFYHHQRLGILTQNRYAAATFMLCYLR